MNGHLPDLLRAGAAIHGARVPRARGLGVRACALGGLVGAGILGLLAGLTRLPGVFILPALLLELRGDPGAR